MQAINGHDTPVLRKDDNGCNAPHGSHSRRQPGWKPQPTSQRPTRDTLAPRHGGCAHIAPEQHEDGDGQCVIVEQAFRSNNLPANFTTEFGVDVLLHHPQTGGQGEIGREQRHPHHPNPELALFTVLLVSSSAICKLLMSICQRKRDHSQKHEEHRHHTLP